MKRASSAVARLAPAAAAAAVALAAAAAVALAAAAFPAPAFAAEGDYSIDELSTEVSVEADAAVRVVERQVVTFDQRNVGYIWYLHAPEDGESVRIASVRVAPVDDGGSVIGGWTRLQLVDSRPTLQGHAPGDAAALSVRGTRAQPWYSYNIGDGMVRCWFPIGSDLDVRERAERAREAAAARKAAGGTGEADEPEGGASEADGNGAADAADAAVSTANSEAGEVSGTEAAAAGEGGAAPEGGQGEAAAAAADGTAAAAADGEGTATSAAVATSDAAADAPENHAGETRYAIEADYTVTHRVRVYRDVAELYWRYANSSLPVGARDVNLQVTLPVPADTPVVPNADVMAWGHGPDGGTIEVAADGTVTFHVDAVERGNYAEAHVIFPSWWLDSVAGGGANVFTELRRAAAVAEESQWVDASKRGETWDFKVRVLFMALAAAVMLVGVAAVARFGRSSRSRRALVRVSATLAVVALGEQLFFREPVTTVLLAALAAVVAAVSLMLPAGEGDGEADDAPLGDAP